MNNDIDEMLILIEGFESHKNVIHDIADVNIPLPIEIEQAYKLINSKRDQLS